MGVMKRLATARMLGGGKAGYGSGGGVGISFDMFFDRRGVEQALGRRDRKVLNRLGGYARRTARSSIKRVGGARKAPKKFGKTGRITKAWLKWREECRKQPASPPGSPPYTQTGRLREAIVYGYDRSRKSVVAGALASVMDDVAALHEYGGTRMGKHYPARPYMAPAREKALEQLPRFFREAG